MSIVFENSPPKVFDLNFAELHECDAALTAYGAELGALSTIDSQSSFNDFCRHACALWHEHFPQNRGAVGKLSARLWNRIETEGESIIPTPWGGVVVEHYEHPEVEKFLVIRKDGYLALETHSQKTEHLEVREGEGLLLAGEVGGSQLTVYPLKPGMSFDLAPGAVHCLIGTEELTVFETSTDPLGMDQDLIFIYTPE